MERDEGGRRGEEAKQPTATRTCVTDRRDGSGGDQAGRTRGMRHDKVASSWLLRCETMHQSEYSYSQRARCRV